MEVLIGCFFNAVWLGASWLCFYLLRYVFSFVNLPLWLENTTIGLVSFVVGLLGMFSFIEIFINKNGWKRYRELLKGLLLGLLLPVVGCCVFAVLLYLFLAPYGLGEEKEKLIVGVAATLLYFSVMGIINKRAERMAETEALDANIKGKHEEEKAAD